MFSIALTLAAAAFFHMLRTVIVLADDRRIARAARPAGRCLTRAVRPAGRISRRAVSSLTGTFHTVEPFKPFARPLQSF